ncbi:MAG: uridine kinase, partial [Clostridia bacterium]|nr:uridine kinase [Clostridia bacterium]
MTVVTIAGGSASGKSTLASALQKELPSCAVVAMDAYYKQERDLPLVTLPNGKTYRDYNCPEAFDLAKL